MTKLAPENNGTQLNSTDRFCTEIIYYYIKIVLDLNSTILCGNTHQHHHIKNRAKVSIFTQYNHPFPRIAPIFTIL